MPKRHPQRRYRLLIPLYFLSSSSTSRRLAWGSLSGFPPFDVIFINFKNDIALEVFCGRKNKHIRYWCRLLSAAQPYRSFTWMYWNLNWAITFVSFAMIAATRRLSPLSVFCKSGGQRRSQFTQWGIKLRNGYLRLRPLIPWAFHLSGLLCFCINTDTCLIIFCLLCLCFLLKQRPY